MSEKELVRICAWCDSLISDTGEKLYNIASVCHCETCKKSRGEITHGICKSCYKVQLDALKKFKVEVFKSERGQ